MILKLLIVCWSLPEGSIILHVGSLPAEALVKQDDGSYVRLPAEKYLYLLPNMKVESSYIGPTGAKLGVWEPVE